MTKSIEALANLDDTVTIRHRDTITQKRVSFKQLTVHQPERGDQTD